MSSHATDLSVYAKSSSSIFLADSIDFIYRSQFDCADLFITRLLQQLLKPTLESLILRFNNNNKLCGS